MALITLKKRQEFLRIRGGKRSSTPAFLLEGKQRSPNSDRAANTPLRPRFGFIVTRKMPKLEIREDVFEPLDWIPPHRIYRSKLDVGYLEQGSGQVNASMNRIEVRGSNPDEQLVLRFHWLDTFVCTPQCTIEKAPVLGDPVGFIRVHAGHPADIVIENASEVKDHLATRS